MEQHLAAENRRQAFYEALTAFQQTLSVALATEHFYEDTSAERIATYKHDLKHFRSLRSSAQQRFAESIDYSQYEKQIRKVMDSHIQAPDVEVVTNLVNIFDVEAFDQEVERRIGPAAKADTIANRLVKTIHERMDEDPVFFKKFADLVQKAIDDYRQQRISDTEYLRQVTEYLSTVRQGHDVELPEELAAYREAPAYYGVIGEMLESYGPEQAGRKKMATEMAIGIENTIDPMKGRDWTVRDDIQKDMANAIDDFLFEARDRYGVSFNTADMDSIIERCLSIAKKLAGG
jgi:type I restriction enzyme R subunit